MSIVIAVAWMAFLVLPSTSQAGGFLGMFGGGTNKISASSVLENADITSAFLQGIDDLLGNRIEDSKICAKVRDLQGLSRMIGPTPDWRVEAGRELIRKLCSVESAPPQLKLDVKERMTPPVVKLYQAPVADHAAYIEAAEIDFIHFDVQKYVEIGTNVVVIEEVPISKTVADLQRDMYQRYFPAAQSTNISSGGADTNTPDPNSPVPNPVDPSATE